MYISIIAGKYRGRKIAVPTSDKTRPTSSRLRETVFNILQARIEGAHFLDLFAGSGAMGIEALSRGAASATFIERDKVACQTIESNLKSLKCEEEHLLIRGDGFTALRLIQPLYPFDIVYIDPPYPKTEGEMKTIYQLLDDLQESAHVASNALLFLELPLQMELSSSQLAEGLQLIKSRKSGNTTLVELRKERSTV